MKNWQKFISVVILSIVTFIGFPNSSAHSHNIDSIPSAQTSFPANLDGIILFSDDFSDGNADGWTPDFDGTWSVINEQYVVDVRGGSDLRAISLAGDPAWTDYCFDVDIQSEEGGSKIVLFWYLSESNYYSIGIIAVDFADYYKVNLVSVKDGVGTTVLNNDFPHDNFALHHLAVVVKGDHITAAVDGQPVIDYIDIGTAVLNGRIGLQGFTGSLGEPNRVHFDNVVVRGFASIYLPVILR